MAKIHALIEKRLLSKDIKIYVSRRLDRLFLIKILGAKRRAKIIYLSNLALYQENFKFAKAGINVANTGYFLADFSYWVNKDAFEYKSVAIIPAGKGSEMYPNGVGYINDLIEWYSSIDVIVLPIRISSGIQNKFIEAFVMGKFIFAYNSIFLAIPSLAQERYGVFELGKDYSKDGIIDMGLREMAFKKEMYV